MDILTPYIYIQSFPHCERIGFNRDEHIIATTWKVKNFQFTRGLFLFFPPQHSIFTKSKEIKIGEEIGKRIYRSTNIHSKMNGNYLISVSAMFNSLVQCSALWPVTNRARYVHALRINAAQVLTPAFVQHSLFFFSYENRLCTFSTTGRLWSRGSSRDTSFPLASSPYFKPWPWFMAISRRSSLRFPNFSIITRNWIEAEPIKRPFSSWIIRGTMRIFRLSSIPFFFFSFAWN